VSVEVVAPAPPRNVAAERGPSLMQRIAARVGTHRFLRLMRLYPPYLGAGVRVRHVAPDLSRVEVEMPLTIWNRNFVGTQFGGSLYAMCDPFFMLMLMHRLGPAYVVWDKAATIEFVRPGRGRVSATFELAAERVEEIRRDADAGEKVLPRFDAVVVGDDGTVVARIEKVLYVRRKGR
jgi:acyl-coenzyme A thioesterase PaaI-like protein